MKIKFVCIRHYFFQLDKIPTEKLGKSEWLTRTDVRKLEKMYKCNSLPKSIEFPIQLGFDKSFYNYFNKNSYRATQYIKEVVELSSEFFSQPNSKLPIISWNIDSEILELQNIRLSAYQMCEGHRAVH